MFGNVRSAGAAVAFITNADVMHFSAKENFQGTIRGFALCELKNGKPERKADKDKKISVIFQSSLKFRSAGTPI